MRSWAEPVWPEDYHETLSKLDAAGARVDEATIMLHEATEQARPFWDYQVNHRRTEVLRLEAKIREMKRNVVYGQEAPDARRMCES